MTTFVCYLAYLTPEESDTKKFLLKNNINRIATTSVYKIT